MTVGKVFKKSLQIRMGIDGFLVPAYRSKKTNLVPFALWKHFFSRNCF